MMSANQSREVIIEIVFFSVFRLTMDNYCQRRSLYESISTKCRVICNNIFDLLCELRVSDKNQRLSERHNQRD